MAKYDITRTCGCEETVELFGKSSERERKIEYYETQECATCKAKRQGLEPVEMHYSEYKENYSDYKTGEYNKKTKTIIVFIKKETVEVEEVEVEVEVEEEMLVSEIQADFKENKASESAKKLMHAIADSKQIKKEDYPKLKPVLLGIDGNIKVRDEKELADMVIKIVNEGK